MTHDELFVIAARVAELRGQEQIEHALVLADAMDEAGWNDSSVPIGPPKERGWELLDVITTLTPGILGYFYRGCLVLRTQACLRGAREIRGLPDVKRYPPSIRHTLHSVDVEHALRQRVPLFNRSIFLLVDEYGHYEVRDCMTREPVYALCAI